MMIMLLCTQYQSVEVGAVEDASGGVFLTLLLILELDVLRVNPVQLTVLVEVQRTARQRHEHWRQLLHTNRHRYRHTHRHTYTHTYRQTYIHTDTHTHTHTHTHWNTHKQLEALSLSTRFNDHFPGGLGLAGTRIFPFWILLELRMTEVVVTTGAVRRAKLQSNHHYQQTNIQFFYRPDALPVAQPTVSKHWRENNWKHLESTNLHQGRSFSTHSSSIVYIVLNRIYVSYSLFHCDQTLRHLTSTELWNCQSYMVIIIWSRNIYRIE